MGLNWIVRRSIERQRPPQRLFSTSHLPGCRATRASPSQPGVAWSATPRAAAREGRSMCIWENRAGAEGANGV